MPTSNPNPPTLVQSLQKIAPQIGATVQHHPDWPLVGKITFKNGRVSYFKHNVFDLNPMGAASIAKDKDFATYFLQQQGYPTIPHSRAFYSTEHAAAYSIEKRGIAEAVEYAHSIGFPLVVKPNDGSQGVGVSVVHTEEDLLQAINQILANHPIALIQSLVAGNDYRIVVLDGKIMAAYHRIPLNVIGDGQSTIQELFEAKRLQLEQSHRSINVSLTSQRVISKLADQGLTSQSVIAPNQQVFLLDNANLSAGGDAVEVTEQMHPEFRRVCGHMAQDMGLRYCGVDLMIQGNISQPPQSWWVIEVNGAPGMSHFARLGQAQAQKVEDVYLKVLVQLEQGETVPMIPVMSTPDPLASQLAESVKL